MLIVTHAASTAVPPASWYRFESLTDPTIDTQGLCNLTNPRPIFEPQVQQQGLSSVGNFAVFNYNTPPVPAHSLRSWGAQSCAPRADARSSVIMHQSG